MEPKQGRDAALVPTTADSAEIETVAAWEEIEEGRYMPRRVRGSCHGRELG